MKYLLHSESYVLRASTAVWYFLMLTLCFTYCEGFKETRYKFWLGPNYRGTHSTSRGISTMIHTTGAFPNFLLNGTSMGLKSLEGDVNFFAFIKSFSDLYAPRELEILELGCGEGRASGMLAKALLDKLDTIPHITCFNLKGYKSVKRGPPISGAVSSSEPKEIEKMLKHYNIDIQNKAAFPEVVLGDASKYPWPFPDNCFSIMFSTATLSKITKLEVVTSEVIRTLQPGGLAVLGLGGTSKCDMNFYMLPAEKRQLFCGLVSIGGTSATVAVTMKTPFDNLEKEDSTLWLENYGKKYSGAMVTSVLISKVNLNGSLLSCPKKPAVKNAVSLALKHCRQYTPSWDRGVRVMSKFLQKVESNESTISN